MKDTTLFVGMDVHKESIFVSVLEAGELTVVRVPSEQEESVRDLVRCRENLREDILRERHRLLRFLLRQGRRFSAGGRWTLRHWAWLRSHTACDRLGRRTCDRLA